MSNLKIGDKVKLNIDHLFKKNWIGIPITTREKLIDQQDEEFEVINVTRYGSYKISNNMNINFTKDELILIEPKKEETKEEKSQNIDTDAKKIPAIVKEELFNMIKDVNLVIADSKRNGDYNTVIKSIEMKRNLLADLNFFFKKVNSQENYYTNSSLSYK